MNERNDHAAEALSLIDGKNQPPSAHDWGNPEADRMIAIAQVHAQLAVAEQLRIGNEVALRQATFNLHPSGTVSAINDEQTVERLWAALGVSNE